MAEFRDPDTRDFFDAWIASKRDDSYTHPLVEEAFGAGWDAAMRAIREVRAAKMKATAYQPARSIADKPTTDKPSGPFKSPV